MTLRIALAQDNFLVGSIPENAQKVRLLAQQAKAQQSDIIVFPELCLTGYPPEDLLFRPSLTPRINDALASLADIRDIVLVLGYPKIVQGQLYNMAGAWLNGQCLVEYAKQKLPNYQVFDEKRYFVEGQSASAFSYKNTCIALTVCEDIWHDEPVANAKALGAELILNLNASPFHINKQVERLSAVQQRARENQVAIAYVNLVGGQDELVFDGGSFVVNPSGEVVKEGLLFKAELTVIDFDGKTKQFIRQDRAPALSVEASVYQALVLGVRDYVQKSGFKGVVLGLSGGIDSGLVLAIAVDALGAESVNAVMMPYHYTSQMSLDDAAEEAQILGVNYSIIEIAPVVESFQQKIAQKSKRLTREKTKENLQAH